MDKSWITKKSWNVEYKEGVKNFLEFASVSVNSENKILCPCRVCINRDLLSLNDVEVHLFQNGFFAGYRVWSFHGEEHINSRSAGVTSARSGPPIEQIDEEDDVMLEELLRDTFEIRNDPTVPVSDDTEPPPKKVGRDDDLLTKLFADAKTALYPGCKTSSKLSFILQLYRLKCMYSWSAKSFDTLLQLLLSTFPGGNQVPKNTYEVKKLLKAFHMGYQKIDACPNDCVLYWEDEADKENCKNCNFSRWDLKKLPTSKKPAKIMRYFPLIPRLQRLFQNRKTAEEMLWHQTGRNKDGLIRHPADGEAWKAFDIRYPDFAADPRNIRLGLSSDGFNPNKVMSTTYNIWPVIVVPYNMPPWIGMKHDSFIRAKLLWISITMSCSHVEMLKSMPWKQSLLKRESL